jgi:hypothetical protein
MSSEALRIALMHGCISIVECMQGRVFAECSVPYSHGFITVSAANSAPNVVHHERNFNYDQGVKSYLSHVRGHIGDMEILDKDYVASAG